MKGRQLKRWEVVRFMEEETAGFIVSSGDQNYTWQELKSVFAHDISVCSWYEYIEEPKPKTLAERHFDHGFYSLKKASPRNNELASYICEVTQWLEAQPENKPRIDLAEAFAERFSPDMIGREVVLSWLRANQ